MSDIKLTHGPNQCCECVPYLEAKLSRFEVALRYIIDMSTNLGSSKRKAAEALAEQGDK